MKNDDTKADIKRQRREKAEKTISRLHQTISEINESVDRQKKTGIDTGALESMLEFLNSVERRCSNLLLDSDAATRAIRASVAASTDNGVEDVGELVGEMGEQVMENAVNEDGVYAILENSIPISASVLATVYNLSQQIRESSEKMQQELSNLTNELQRKMNETAESTSDSMTGQTANLAISLTQTTSQTIDGILGSVQDVADKMKNDILNPSEGEGIDKMVQNTASVTPGMVENAQQASSEMSSSVLPNVNALSTHTDEICNRMEADAFEQVCGFVGYETASAIRNCMEYGNEPADQVDLGGLFLECATRAAYDINNGMDAKLATINLVDDMAYGLGTLGDSIYGDSSSLASEMAQIGIDAFEEYILETEYLSANLPYGVPSVQQSMLGTAANVGQKLFNGIGSIASSLANGDSSQIQAAAGQVFNGLQSFAGQKAVNNLSYAVLSKATGLSGGMLDMAASLTGNMVNSLMSKIGDMLNSGEESAERAREDTQQESDNIQSAAQQTQWKFDQNNWNADWKNKDAKGNRGTVDLMSLLKKVGKKLSNLIKGLFNKKKNSNKGDKSTTPTTPLNASSGQDAYETMVTKNKDEPTFGWKGESAEFTRGLEMMMHDGDQQLINPYGQRDAEWTIYSFRPADRDRGYPQIAITPSSFQTLDSMDALLNNIPYVVVKEYFFKNTASTMINFVKKIMNSAKESSAKISNEIDAESNGSKGAKEIGKDLMKKLKDAFENIGLYEAAIQIPYVFYIGLRKRQFGNTYIFPYIAKNSTVINQASNDQEWNGNGGFLAKVKEWVSELTEFAGGLALQLAGSSGQSVKAFNAPTWNLSDGNKISFSFDMMLINDHIIKTRNNYMCVNTIIHNNRSIQKAVLAFPGALYEIWLPTGQRHLMCTGSFQLFPLGLNRKVPDRFFEDLGPGANFRIGVHHGDIQMKQPHQQNEVVPDGYKLQVTFTSCLANNMNSSVFQYYVNMTGYDDYQSEKAGQEGKDDIFQKVEDSITGKNESGGENTKDPIAKAISDAAEMAEGKKKDIAINEQSFREIFSRAVSDAASATTSDTDEYIEKFDESTYNKKLQRLKSSQGDLSMNADSVVDTIRSAQHIVRESNKFLSKLYNAPENNLWYRPYGKEELYTEIEPDHRQILRKQYQQTFSEILEVDGQISETENKLSRIGGLLSSKTRLSDRNPLLEEKVEQSQKIDELKTKREYLTDQIIQIDAELIDEAFEEHDDAVSIAKNDLTLDVFKQVWNEKIMNTYEKEKLQYLTSVEKERYFNDKVRDLRKFDKFGILDHADWFFRVVVLDHVVNEIQRLILWFKNCSYDDYETIYKIVRKLNLLILDVESVKSDGFDINSTNLFRISEEDAMQFTKLDGMLDGSTLYGLFRNEVRLNFTQKSSAETEQQSEGQIPQDKEIVSEQMSEISIRNMRKVRDDVVVRVWGNESNLTKAAYALINKDDVANIETSDGQTISFNSIRDLKSRIIELKLNTHRTEDDDNELKQLLGSLANEISGIKEALVMKKIDEMRNGASEKVETMDNDINAKQTVI